MLDLEPIKTREARKTGRNPDGGTIAALVAEVEDLRAEVERLRARCRLTAQRLIAAVGSCGGPENAEEAALRVAVKVEALKARIAELEGEGDDGG